MFALNYYLTRFYRLWWWDSHRAEEQRGSSCGSHSQLPGGFCVEIDFFWQVLRQHLGTQQALDALGVDFCSLPSGSVFEQKKIVLLWHHPSEISVCAERLVPGSESLTWARSGINGIKMASCSHFEGLVANTSKEEIYLMYNNTWNVRSKTIL